MIIGCTGLALGMHQREPVAVQVGIEVVATQRRETLCMLYVECIVHGRDGVERVIILCCSLTSVGVQCRLNQYHGVAQTFYDVGILCSHEVIGSQNRCVGTCQFSTVYVIAQLDHHLLVVVVGGESIIGIHQFHVVLSDAFQILNVLWCRNM